MTLAERLRPYVRAAFTGLYVRSHEHDDATREIGHLCQDEGWTLATWDLDRGLAVAGPGDGGSAVPGVADPLAAIRSLAALATPEGTALLVLRNFHRYLGSVEVVQALDTQLAAGKQARTFVVILAPVVQVPVELEKLFAVVDHDLPDRDQLLAIARGVATEPGDLPEGAELEAVLDAAAGLTRAEAENAFALALVRAEARPAGHDRPDRPARVTPDVLWELKMADLRKSGLLEMHRGGDRFADLGGLDNLKRFCLQALGSQSRRARARGVLLLGPPGVGKSRFAKALGREAGRPTVVLDLGRLKGSLVGQSEERTRQALRILSATRPNIAFADEIEKGLAAVQGVTGAGDGGVSAGQFGTLLTHMADHAGDSFFVFTANDVSRLPAEFTRAGRLNAIFFIDLPGPAERERIWQIHRDRFAIDGAQRRPEDRDWSGAEIETCCETADLLGITLQEAAQFIVPVAVTAGESIERLRNWAAGRCLAADRTGLYTRTVEVAGKPGRGIRRDPSAN